jgi:translation elongation factor EF-Tu-like GTPase
MKKIFTVEDIFWIHGRGVVVAGKEVEHSNVKAGDSVEIIRPDKTRLASQIMGTEWITRVSWVEGERKPFALWLKDLTRTDVPRGSEVFLVVS